MAKILFSNGVRGSLGKINKRMVKGQPIIFIEADGDSRHIAYDSADIDVVKVFHGCNLLS